MNNKLYRHKRFWLAVCILAYLLLGFFHVPGVLHAQLQKQAREQLNMGLSINEIDFNPLTFVTRLHGIELTDSQQHPWFTASQLRLDFDPSHLLWGQWHVSELSLISPAIEVSTAPSGEWLIPRFQLPPTSPDEASSEPNYAVANISLKGGRMDVNAGQVSQGFALNIKQLDVQHEQFNPNDIDTTFSIGIVTQQDEQLQLSGHYNHPQANISTELTVHNWQSATLLQLLPEDLAVSSDQGLLSARGSLNWTLGGLPVVSFTEMNWMDWHLNWAEQVSVTGLYSQWQGLSIDAELRQIRLAALSSEEANWQLNWPINLPEPTTSKGSNEVSGWDIDVTQVSLSDWPLVVIDHTLNSQFAAGLKQLTLSNLNNRLTSIEFKSRWQLDAAGALLINGQTGVEPGMLNADIDIKQLELPSVSPWSADAAGLVLHQGTLSSQQSLSLDESGWELTGQVSVDQGMVHNTLGQQVAEIGRLMVGESRVDNRQRSIVIDQIVLDQARGNLIIDPDNTLNIKHLGGTASSTSEAATSPALPAWQIDIGSVEFRDTETALIDQTTEPPVTTRLSALNGAITGLSSTNLSRTDVDLSARFNQYSPVSITGQINPLSTDAYTNLSIRIDDLD